MFADLKLPTAARASVQVCTACAIRSSPRLSCRASLNSANAQRRKYQLQKRSHTCLDSTSGRLRVLRAVLDDVKGGTGKCARVKMLDSNTAMSL